MQVYALDVSGLAYLIYHIGVSQVWNIFPNFFAYFVICDLACSKHRPMA